MISLTTVQLRTSRDNLWAVIASIAGLAATEGRALSAAECAEFDAAIERLEYITTRLRGALEIEAHLAEAGT